MAKAHMKEQGKLVEVFPACFYCTHVEQVGTQDNAADVEGSLVGWTCKAFPKGIPYDILKRYSKHVKPAAGQKGSFVFRSKRLQTGGGETGWEYITFDGKYVETLEEAND